MMNPEEKSAPIASSRIQWRRVSPIALIYFLIKMLHQAVNLWYVLIPIIAGGEGFRDFVFNQLIYAVAALAVIALFIKYWFFRFYEDEGCIHIRSGLFNRTRLTLNYDRVQQADIIQPFYFRPFGLATLGLESAGSTQKEVALPGIRFEYAETLKQTILDFKEKLGTKTAQPSAVESPIEKKISYRLLLKPAEIARYGLMHNGLIFLLPVLAPLTQNPQLFQTYLSPLENTWLFDYLFHSSHQDDFFSFVAAVGFLIIVAIVILFIASTVVALFRFWNYDLQRSGNQFQYRAGLATISTRGFRLQKLQKVVVSQGLIARLLKRYSLTITKAGATHVQEGTPQADKQRFLVPVLDNAELQRFMSELKLPNASWKGINPFFIINLGGWFSLIFGTLLAIVLAATELSFIWLLLLFPTIFLLVWRRWRCWGVYHDDEWFAVKTGFIGQRITFIPAPKTQKTAVYQPLWLRPLGLVQLGVWSGAGAIYVPALEQSWAQNTRDRLQWQVINYKKRWF